MEAINLKRKKNDLIKNIGALLEDFTNDVGPVDITITTNWQQEPRKPFIKGLPNVGDLTFEYKTIVTITI